VRAGDTVTGTRRVLEKYERQGSGFVAFRAEANNQRGEHVARYDYTCIFSYARGQRNVPRDRGMAQPAPLIVSESQEIFDRKNELRLACLRATQ
jgi:hypothetical protein